MCIRDRINTLPGFTAISMYPKMMAVSYTHLDVYKRQGLPIVKGLIDLHGGGFLLKSKPRAGTEVTITLPAERVMDTLAALPEPKAKPRAA